jgi:3-hydroxyisobutyrate dehydrogenase
MTVRLPVAFLGLGVMGAPMAINLANRGLPVIAWNRTPNRPGVALAQQAGVKVVPTLAEAVADCPFIFTCLGDVPDVEAVLLGESGVVHFAPPQSLIVDFSTIGAKAAQAIATQLKQNQLRFLDAPVSGGDIGAKQGTLTIMVGGELTDFEQVKPYLEALGKAIYYCGPGGSGQSVKLCNQVLAALNMVGLCEAITLAHQQGIDPQLMIEVCSTGAAGSWALSHLAPKIVQQDLAPGFMVKHILKDLRLVQETLTTSLPGLSLAEAQFQQVAQLDQGPEQGTQAMIRAYQTVDKGDAAPTPDPLT